MIYKIKMKMLNLILVMSLFISLFQNYSYSSTYSPKIDSNFYIKVDHGKVIDSYFGDKKEKYIIIQDLHCDPKAQEKIYKIIEDIKTEYKKDAKFLGIEGAYKGKISTKIISKIKEKKLREKFINYLFERGYITGAELYDIKNPGKLNLEGIEDVDLYNKHFNILYQSLNYKQDLNYIFYNTINDIKNAEKYLYNKEMKDFKNIQDKNNSGILNTEEYLEELLKYCINIGIDIKKYENISLVLDIKNMKSKIDLYKVWQESEIVIKKLEPFLKDKNILKNFKQEKEYYRHLAKILKTKNIDINRNYPHLSEYFYFLEKMERINYLKLYDEKNDLESVISEKLLGNTRYDGLELNYAEKYLDIYKRYLLNNANDREVALFLNDSDIFDRLKKFTNRVLRKKYLEENEKKLKQAENLMNIFYELADTRSEIFIKNLDSSDGSLIKILLIGGYHVEKIKENLKSRGISYDVIIPNVEKNSEGIFYEKRLKEVSKKLGIKGNQKYYNDKILKDRLQVLSLFQGLNEDKIYSQNQQKVVYEIIAKLFDGYLSEEDRSALYKDFLQSYGIEKIQENSIKEKRIISFIQKNYRFFEKLINRQIIFINPLKSIQTLCFWRGKSKYNQTGFWDGESFFKFNEKTKKYRLKDKIAIISPFLNQNQYVEYMKNNIDVIFEWFMINSQIINNYFFYNKGESNILLLFIELGIQNNLDIESFLILQQYILQNWQNIKNFHNFPNFQIIQKLDKIFNKIKNLDKESIEKVIDFIKLKPKFNFNFSFYYMEQKFWEYIETENKSIKDIRKDIFYEDLENEQEESSAYLGKVKGLITYPTVELLKEMAIFIDEFLNIIDIKKIFKEADKKVKIRVVENSKVEGEDSVIGIEAHYDEFENLELVMTKKMVEILKQTKDFIWEEEYEKLIQEIIEHEKKELTLIRQGVEQEEAHEIALRESGEMQRKFQKMILQMTEEDIETFLEKNIKENNWLRLEEYEKFQAQELKEIFLMQLRLFRLDIYPLVFWRGKTQYKNGEGFFDGTNLFQKQLMQSDKIFQIFNVYTPFWLFANEYTEDRKNFKQLFLTKNIFSLEEDLIQYSYFSFKKVEFEIVEGDEINFQGIIVVPFSLSEQTGNFIKGEIKIRTTIGTFKIFELLKELGINYQESFKKIIEHEAVEAIIDFYDLPYTNPHQTALSFVPNDYFLQIVEKLELENLDFNFLVEIYDLFLKVDKNITFEKFINFINGFRDLQNLKPLEQNYITKLDWVRILKEINTGLENTNQQIDKRVLNMFIINLQNIYFLIENMPEEIKNNIWKKYGKLKQKFEIIENFELYTVSNEEKINIVQIRDLSKIKDLVSYILDNNEIFDSVINHIYLIAGQYEYERFKNLFENLLKIDNSFQEIFLEIKSSLEVLYNLNSSNKQLLNAQKVLKEKLIEIREKVKKAKNKDLLPNAKEKEAYIHFVNICMAKNIYELRFELYRDLNLLIKNLYFEERIKRKDFALFRFMSENIVAYRALVGLNEKDIEKIFLIGDRGNPKYNVFDVSCNRKGLEVIFSGKRGGDSTSETTSGTVQVTTSSSFAKNFRGETNSIVKIFIPKVHKTFDVSLLFYGTHNEKEINALFFLSNFIQKIDDKLNPNFVDLSVLGQKFEESEEKVFSSIFASPLQNFLETMNRVPFIRFSVEDVKNHFITQNFVVNSSLFKFFRLFFRISQVSYQMLGIIKKIDPFFNFYPTLQQILPSSFLMSQERSSFFMAEEISLIKHPQLSASQKSSRYLEMPIQKIFPATNLWVNYDPLERNLYLKTRNIIVEKMLFLETQLRLLNIFPIIDFISFKIGNPYIDREEGEILFSFNIFDSLNLCINIILSFGRQQNYEIKTYSLKEFLNEVNRTNLIYGLQNVVNAGPDIAFAVKFVEDANRYLRSEFLKKIKFEQSQTYELEEGEDVTVDSFQAQDTISQEQKFVSVAKKEKDLVVEQTQKAYSQDESLGIFNPEFNQTQIFKTAEAENVQAEYLQKQNRFFQTQSQKLSSEKLTKVEMLQQQDFQDKKRQLQSFEMDNGQMEIDYFQEQNPFFGVQKQKIRVQGQKIKITQSQKFFEFNPLIKIEKQKISKIKKIDESNIAQDGVFFSKIPKYFLKYLYIKEVQGEEKVFLKEDIFNYPEILNFFMDYMLEFLIDNYYSLDMPSHSYVPFMMDGLTIEQYNRVYKERMNHDKRHIFRVYNMVKDICSIVGINGKDKFIAVVYAIFHDSCRRGEGEDLWDQESSALATEFLVSLGFDIKELVEVRNSVALKNTRCVLDNPRIADKIAMIIDIADSVDIVRVKEIWDGSQVYRNLSKFHLSDEKRNKIFNLIGLYMGFAIWMKNNESKNFKNTYKEIGLYNEIFGYYLSKKMGDFYSFDMYKQGGWYASENRPLDLKKVSYTYMKEKMKDYKKNILIKLITKFSDENLQNFFIFINENKDKIEILDVLFILIFNEYISLDFFDKKEQYGNLLDLLKLFINKKIDEQDLKNFGQKVFLKKYPFNVLDILKFLAEIDNIDERKKIIARFNNFLENYNSGYNFNYNLNFDIFKFQSDIKDPNISISEILKKYSNGKYQQEVGIFPPSDEESSFLGTLLHLSTYPLVKPLEEIAVFVNYFNSKGDLDRKKVNIKISSVYDNDLIGLEGHYDEYGNLEIIMTKKMLEILETIKRIFGENIYNQLLNEIIEHEKIELNLIKQGITQEKAHEIALQQAGFFQKAFNTFILENKFFLIDLKDIIVQFFQLIEFPLFLKKNFYLTQSIYQKAIFSLIPIQSFLIGEEVIFSLSDVNIKYFIKVPFNIFSKEFYSLKILDPIRNKMATLELTDQVYTDDEELRKRIVLYKNPELKKVSIIVKTSTIVFNFFKYLETRKEIESKESFIYLQNKQEMYFVDKLVMIIKKIKTQLESGKKEVSKKELNMWIITLQNIYFLIESLPNNIKLRIWENNKELEYKFKEIEQLTLLKKESREDNIELEKYKDLEKIKILIEELLNNEKIFNEIVFYEFSILPKYEYEEFKKIFKDLMKIDLKMEDYFKNIKMNLEVLYNLNSNDQELTDAQILLKNNLATIEKLFNSKGIGILLPNQNSRESYIFFVNICMARNLEELKEVLFQRMNILIKRQYVNLRIVYKDHSSYRYLDENVILYRGLNFSKNNRDIVIASIFNNGDYGNPSYNVFEVFFNNDYRGRAYSGAKIDEQTQTVTGLTQFTSKIEIAKRFSIYGGDIEQVYILKGTETYDMSLLSSWNHEQAEVNFLGIPPCFIKKIGEDLNPNFVNFELLKEINYLDGDLTFKNLFSFQLERLFSILGVFTPYFLSYMPNKEFRIMQEYYKYKEYVFDHNYRNIFCNFNILNFNVLKILNNFLLFRYPFFRLYPTLKNPFYIFNIFRLYDILSLNFFEISFDEIVTTEQFLEYFQKRDKIYSYQSSSFNRKSAANLDFAVKFVNDAKKYLITEFEKNIQIKDINFQNLDFINFMAKFLIDKLYLLKMPRSYDVSFSKELYKEEIQEYSDGDDGYFEGKDDYVKREIHDNRHIFRVYNMVKDLCDIVGIKGKDKFITVVYAIFHDSCRRGEGEDLWDQESAALATEFLVYLGFDIKDLTEIRYAVATKDTRFLSQSPSMADKMAMLIDIADSIDIVRVREKWDFTKVHNNLLKIGITEDSEKYKQVLKLIIFYMGFAKYMNNSEVKDILAPEDLKKQFFYMSKLIVYSSSSQMNSYEDLISAYHSFKEELFSSLILKYYNWIQKVLDKIDQKYKTRFYDLLKREDLNKIEGKFITLDEKMQEEFILALLNDFQKGINISIIENKLKNGLYFDTLKDQDEASFFGKLFYLTTYPLMKPLEEIAVFVKETIDYIDSIGILGDINLNIKIVKNSKNIGEKEVISLEGRYDEKGNLEIIMTEKMLEILKEIKNIMGENIYNKLISEIVEHEKIELNLIKQGIHQEKAHKIALKNAGLFQLEFQKIILNMNKLEYENLGYQEIQDILDEIVMRMIEITSKNDFTQKGILKMFPKIEKKLIDDISKLCYSNKIITIDITGKKVADVLEEISALKIEQKIGLNVVLLGEPIDLENIDKLFIYIDRMSNQMLEIDWVIGKEVLKLIKTNKLKLEFFLSKGRVHLARVISNGYFLTATGLVTEDLYTNLLAKYNRTNLTAKEIALIINREFYQNKYDGEILNSFCSGIIGEETKRINQMLIGLDVELKDEKLKISENFINRDILKNKSVKIQETTKEGLILLTEFDLNKVDKVEDMFSLNIDLAKNVIVLGREELDTVNVNKIKLNFSKVNILMKRFFGKIFKKINKLAFLDKKTDFNINSNLLKAVSASA